MPCMSMRLFPWMERTVLLLYKFLVDMRINLCGTDIGVAKQLLQYAQVHAGFQAMRGKAVTERMRRDLLGEVRGVLLHYLPGTHARHRFAPRI